MHPPMIFKYALSDPGRMEILAQNILGTSAPNYYSTSALSGSQTWVTMGQSGIYHPT